MSVADLLPKLTGYRRAELIGECLLLEGDCLDILPSIPEAAVDAVVTDIPYAKVNRDSGGLRNLDKGIADVATFTIQDAADMAAAADTCHVFCATEQVSELRSALIARGMTTRLCVWEKTNPSPMNGDKMWLSSIECCVFGRKPLAYFGAFCQSAVWRGPIARH